MISSPRTASFNRTRLLAVSPRYPGLEALAAFVSSARSPRDDRSDGRRALSAACTGPDALRCRRTFDRKPPAGGWPSLCTQSPPNLSSSTRSSLIRRCHYRWLGGGCLYCPRALVPECEAVIRRSNYLSACRRRDSPLDQPAHRGVSWLCGLWRNLRVRQGDGSSVARSWLCSPQRSGQRFSGRFCEITSVR